MRTKLPLLLTALLLLARPSHAYIEVPYTLGRLVNDSTTITVLKVTAVDRVKNTITYSKVEDLKGKSPDVVKHNIAQAGFHPREWQTVMAWASEGKTSVFFHNGSASETCIDNYWYQCYPGGEWWNMYHAEPYLLRTFAGKPEKLASAVRSMLANEEVVITCMVDGDKTAIALRTARVQRLRASLKIADYNAPRDFVGWGGDEIKPLLDMPGYSHLAILPKLPGTANFAILSAHLDADSRPDLLLRSNERIALLQNAGAGSFNELPFPIDGGATAAAFADYNNSAKQSLLLATPTGPRLLTNLGPSAAGPKWRDDSTSLPAQPYSYLTAAAWFRPSAAPTDLPLLILADAYTGLRVYKNKTPGIAPTPNPAAEPPVPVFDDITASLSLSAPRDRLLAILSADLNNDKSPELLLCSATSASILSFSNGQFSPLADGTLSWKNASDFALADLNSDGNIDLALIADGTLRILLNDGRGNFSEQPAASRPALPNLTSLTLVPTAQSPDLLLGALHAPNTYLANDARANFTDRSESLGLHRRLFNTRALLALPNGDLAQLNENQDNTYLIAKK